MNTINWGNVALKHNFVRTHSYQLRSKIFKMLFQPFKPKILKIKLKDTALKMGQRNFSIKI